MPKVITCSSPESILDKRLCQLSEQSGVGAVDFFAVEYGFQQYFLAGEPELKLLALYQIERQAGDIQILMSVTDQVEPLSQAMVNNSSNFEDVTQNHGLPIVELSSPLLLETVAISKPWGQEIWYTGIEERGQSAVAGINGTAATPLSWLFSAAPERLTVNRERQINLLKILDPLPEEVYGDLYFELHEEKREVYVVTHVDKTAWPTGEGAIRFGFDQTVRAEYDSDDAFRQAYLQAVQSYEEVRRDVDALFDQQRRQQDIPLDAPVSAEQLKTWHKVLPVDIQSEEAKRRTIMNRFTAVRKLKLGDVVKVPCLTPHALQHGVRTVEFQTPVYERKILSFAQKVLTQRHWDTPDAIELMDLDQPPEEELSIVDQDGGFSLEAVVNFDDFEVFRLTLKGGASWQMAVTGEYGLLMNIAGAVCCGSQFLQKEQAVFLPASRSVLSVSNNSENTAVLLLAQPC